MDAVFAAARPRVRIDCIDGAHRVELEIHTVSVYSLMASRDAAFPELFPVRGHVLYDGRSWQSPETRLL